MNSSEFSLSLAHATGSPPRSLDLLSGFRASRDGNLPRREIVLNLTIQCPILALLLLPSLVTAQTFAFTKIVASPYGTFVNGINDSNVVVGYYIDAENTSHAFSYQNGTVTTIDGPIAGRCA